MGAGGRLREFRARRREAGRLVAIASKEFERFKKTRRLLEAGTEKGGKVADRWPAD